MKNCSVPSRLSLPSLRSLSQLAVAYKEHIRIHKECVVSEKLSLLNFAGHFHKMSRGKQEKSRLSRPAAAWAATAAERTARE